MQIAPIRPYNVGQKQNKQNTNFKATKSISHNLYGYKFDFTNFINSKKNQSLLDSLFRNFDGKLYFHERIAYDQVKHYGMRYTGDSDKYKKMLPSISVDFTPNISDKKKTELIKEYTEIAKDRGYDMEDEIKKFVESFSSNLVTPIRIMEKDFPNRSIFGWEYQKSHYNKPFEINENDIMGLLMVLPSHINSKKLAITEAEQKAIKDLSEKLENFISINGRNYVEKINLEWLEKQKSTTLRKKDGAKGVTFKLDEADPNVHKLMERESSRYCANSYITENLNRLVNQSYIREVLQNDVLSKYQDSIGLRTIKSVKGYRFDPIEILGLNSEFAPEILITPKISQKVIKEGYWTGEGVDKHYVEAKTKSQIEYIAKFDEQDYVLDTIACTEGLTDYSYDISRGINWISWERSNASKISKENQVLNNEENSVKNYRDLIRDIILKSPNYNKMIRAIEEVEKHPDAVTSIINTLLK